MELNTPSEVRSARAHLRPLLHCRATRAHKQQNPIEAARALGSAWRWESVAALCAGKAKLLCTGDKTCAQLHPLLHVAMQCWAGF